MVNVVVFHKTKKTILWCWVSLVLKQQYINVYKLTTIAQGKLESVQSVIEKKQITGAQLTSHSWPVIVYMESSEYFLLDLSQY